MASELVSFVLGLYVQPGCGRTCLALRRGDKGQSCCPKSKGHGPSSTPWTQLGGTGTHRQHEPEVTLMSRLERVHR